MPIVFSGQPGRIVAIQDPAVRASVKLVAADGFGGFDEMKSIISRVTLSQQGNFQFMHTLGSSIYIYVFGDRIGQLTLSGMSFNDTCSGSSDATGIEKIVNYYRQNKVSAREKPVRVTIGAATTFYAYLGQMQVGIADPENRIATFDLPMIMLPDNRR